ncbi:ubiquitin-like modifier-activating enzyme ATG7 [Cylas formicarius]|uniref:ubiquitin-like modifier-activating enzyme ATG7 n=1 Tax=Cylas formicarius TaxID=197179 RepID=UPI00295846F9|nr:ubiquitin-like modifier-activating enzyme ATG7 [Cylas formicarius]
MTEKIMYCPFTSSVNPSFWNKLTALKLDVDKLSETEHHVWGYFHILGSENVPSSVVEVDSTSFNECFVSQKVYIPFEGKVINKNTIEQFKECDKMHLINKEGNNLLGTIKSGEILRRPSLLNNFFVLSFADLKKYHYYYWFAFPVPGGLKLEKSSEQLISELFSETFLEGLLNDFTALVDLQKSYFVVENCGDRLIAHTLESKIKKLNKENIHNIYFAFYNTSNNLSLIGSQLRNYVAVILFYCPFLKGSLQNFLAFQINRTTSFSCNKSILYSFNLPTDFEMDSISWVGWEKNERGKMGPRFANMKNTLDPQILAENSVDLNLKLMKWRILPDINLDKIKQTKCLLLGAGTLGCSVARNLLAWGVRYITLVDNSTVSFSNPVRQNLFTYEDSVNMKPKATAAADRLKSIFPGVISKGFELNIPMPGHSVGESLLESTTENIDLLTTLMKDHDVVFLLMDSRESRWLPTMLGSFLNKVVINAALGFDSYLVMRHGSRQDHPIETVVAKVRGYKTIHGSNLGCYFCNDVTAPGNSTHDRTLDQQCTVTRPGVSQIAAALATELAISILQHNEGSDAPAFYKTTNTVEDIEIENQCLLGVLPHSIRGFLSSFEQILPANIKYNQCIACSDLILEEFKKSGSEFLLKVFNSAKYLEDVTHLTELYKETDFDEVLEFSDEEIEL